MPGLAAERLMAASMKELFQFLVTDPGQRRGVRDVQTVEV
jgi:hypothetical protein